MFIFQFLELYYCCFIITFPDFLCLDDLVLFTDTLHFFWVLSHYFLFCCSFIFKMKLSLTISSLHPCFDVYVTLNAVFTFNVLLFFSRHNTFLFYFYYYFYFQFGCLVLLIFYFLNSSSKYPNFILSENSFYDIFENSRSSYNLRSQRDLNIPSANT